MTTTKGSLSFTANGIALGGNNANVILDASGATDAIASPKGTTAQRPPGQAGFFRYNSQTNQFEGFTTAWTTFGGGQVTIQNNGVVVNTTTVIDFANGANALMNVIDDFANGRVIVNFDSISGGGGGGGAYQVDVLANGTVHALNSNLNFLNTSTTNVAVTSNAGNTQANISFSVNVAAVVGPAYAQANNAYTEANAAATIATNAYAAANAADVDATNAYGQANLAYTAANSAQTESNTVYAQANAAYTRANLAYTAANSAQTEANTVYAQANLAYAAANSAQTEANLVYSVANLAYGQANAAYGQANSGYSQANLAYTAANSAQTEANTVYAQANLAYAAANSAQTEANLVYSIANSAANTVAAYGNGTLILANANLNFVDTTTANANVIANGTIQANVGFDVNLAAIQAAVVNAGRVYYLDISGTSDVATLNVASQIPSSNAQTSITVNCTGTTKNLIATFITPPNDPNVPSIPPGTAYASLWVTTGLNSQVGNVTIETYVTDASGGSPTLISTTTSPNFGSQTLFNLQWQRTLASPFALTPTNRLMLKVYGARVSGGATCVMTLFGDGVSHQAILQTTISTGSQAFYGVDTYANGTLTLANSSVNFNNTATVNVNAFATGIFANLGFSVNVSSSDWASAANVVAQTAYGQANAAYTRANLAYAAANSAQTEANTIYALANQAVLNVSSGNTSNLVISGNSSNVIIDTRLTATGGATSPGGSDTQIQYNKAGAFGADANLTFDYGGQVLTANGRFDLHGPFAQFVQRGITQANTGFWTTFVGNIFGGTANGDFRLDARNDAQTNINPALAFSRTGGTSNIITMTYGNSLDNPAHLFDGTVQTTGNVGIGAAPGINRLTVQRPAGAVSTADVHLTDGTQWLEFNSNNAAGAYNPITQANDATIIFAGSGGGGSGGNLTIGGWDNAGSGIRIGGNATINLVTTTTNVSGALINATGVQFVSNVVSGNTSNISVTKGAQGLVTIDTVLSTGGGSTPHSPNNSVQLNVSGSLYGTSNLIYDDSTGNFTMNCQTGTVDINVQTFKITQNGEARIVLVSNLAQPAFVQYQSNASVGGYTGVAHTNGDLTPTATPGDMVVRAFSANDIIMDANCVFTTNSIAITGNANVNNVTAGNLIINTGIVEVNSENASQIILNSVGTNFGMIGNPNNQMWSLGWSPFANNIIPAGNNSLCWTSTNVFLNLATNAASTLNVTGAINGHSTINSTSDISSSTLHTSGAANVATTLNVVTSIITAGTITAATNVIVTSDKRTKKKIKKLKKSLEKLLQLQGVEYIRKKDKTNTKQIGVIAQDVQKILPEVVFEGEGGMLGVSYENMTALFIEAIKELNAKVERLEKKLNGKH